MTKLTPIQGAIEKLQAEIFGLENTQANIMGRDVRVFQCKQDVILLETLLPTEKQFISDVYDAGIKNSQKHDFDESHIIRDQYKNGFINSLYPKEVSNG